MGEVIAIHGRCQDCGRPHSRAVRNVLQRLCEACFGKAAAYMEKQRELFEGLLALGVDRETANVMMMAKHEHEGYKVPGDGD